MTTKKGIFLQEQLASERGDRRRKARAARHAESLDKVAVCVKCHEWFKTTEERNFHRAFSGCRRGGAA